MKLPNLCILTLLILWHGMFISIIDASPVETGKKNLKRIVKIDEIFFPPKLVVDESNIYLCNKKYCQIYIFSKKTGKELNAFGRKGEGPGEFSSILDIHCSKDTLLVCSANKLSIFSKQGKLVKECRASYKEKTFIPFGDNYISKRYAYNTKKNTLSLVYTLLDPALKKIKDIFQAVQNDPEEKDKNKQKLIFFHHCRKGVVYKNRFYAGCTDLGFSISVFDKNGSKLYEIKKNQEKIPVTEEIKQKIMHQIKLSTSNDFTRFMARREVVFPEYLPAFINFFIGKNKIFVFKYPLPGSKGRLEVVTLDHSGNLLEQKNVQFGGYYKYLENNDYVSFYNGKLYFLVPHEESSDIVELALETN